jgi:hypothetical protein
MRVIGLAAVIAVSLFAPITTGAQRPAKIWRVRYLGGAGRASPLPAPGSGPDSRRS